MTALDYVTIQHALAHSLRQLTSHDWIVDIQGDTEVLTVCAESELWTYRTTYPKNKFRDNLNSTALVSDLIWQILKSGSQIESRVTR